MNRQVRVLTAGILAASTLALGGNGALASPNSPAPDGLTRVVDDTGTIAVSVPSTWTVRTAPVERSGVAFPFIVADAGDDMMSITVDAQVYIGDLEATVCGVWWLQGDCEPYDDGNIAGYRTRSEECCEGPSRSIALTANPANGQHVTAHVNLSYDETQEAEAGLFDEIAPTVEVLGSPYPDDWQLDPTVLAPPVVPWSQSFWPYGDFHAVPVLGAEPSLGSGCGASGQIGDVIPDGLWAGAVTYVAEEDRWDVNLMCVYSGAAADEVLAQGGATVVAGNRDYLVVDNNERLRSVPNEADAVTTTFADSRTDDRCEIGVSQQMPFDNSQVPGSQAWIRVHDGAVTWVVFGCDAGFFSPGG